MSLVLDSLEIKNFRAFKHLRIEKLGRVNLIVGKNNIGKSSLLEALWIYAEQGEPALLYRILTKRNEIAFEGEAVRRIPGNAQERASSLSNLFFEHQDTRLPHAPIHIGSLNNPPDAVQIDVKWSSQNNGKGPETNGGISSAFTQSPILVLQFGQGSAVGIPCDQEVFWGDRIIPIGHTEYVSAFVVGAAGLSPTDVAVCWDEAAVDNLEDDVLAALRIIAPNVERLMLIGHGKSGGFPAPFVRIGGMNRALPLGSLGEGMNRMLGLILALVNAKDGMLLVDEVDTGLHYSVLPDLWKLIFEVAHRLNVQVFATSHSWDCIQAFQQAAEENEEEEGILIRLEHRDGDVYPVTFDEQKLGIAARELIEVR